ncbi:hypothetical protein LEP1GSC187_3049 [Leptospira santarosai str. ZUN179]|uniref:Uncharacterized protein n=1 Tax=Leptospira santarosai str. ZUN179 TaxID=1049985 RepID=M6ULD4_9LEPT|nr:hypothetical protein LEP1GSC187_3049 [Leptospira santarosai str. ZUN179]
MGTFIKCIFHYMIFAKSDLYGNLISTTVVFGFDRGLSI